ncbi:putative dihydroxyacetone/glyceraldehyde k inase [Carnobacterium sp. 17-4]|uniref:DAK2 domain-containing protein n=1 Tax=Carnobacterium sp. (strain 17-4) TaxID=208596 RepID=UPI0002058F77|nr:DAK2 domain-containing protein [Carnobacterium sp. 17-4]AEB29677.1 putative dihydroxyacetone/glyceraldehyde k inase [Carnobacterium sp. 17-4]
MKVTKLEGKQFRLMIATGANRLDKNAEYVNSLNVFPVPDGDTGTNMNLSLASGAKAVANTTSESVGDLSAALSKGLLMGARGNSGVILSQLFRGFGKAIENKETVTSKDFSEAFTKGVETAYKAVMKPVEGTILTVARESAKVGEKKAKETDDIVEVMEAIVRGAKKSLAKTPDLLPVLKEVGVVDSGGQGLLFIYEGFLEVLSGKIVEEDIYQPSAAEMTELVNAEHHRSVSNHIHTEDIKFGYCTEIMVQIGKGETVDSEFDYDTFRNHLNEIGDSLLVVSDDEIVKVHVHTEYPGEVMNYGQKFGSLLKIKVDNMRVQHETILENESPQPVEKAAKTPYGIIAVAAGEGVQNLFRSLGVDYVISGGQTMNPSTEDILKAIEEVHAEKIIILPNNKNIFMAADQAAEVSELPVVVIPSKTISQGMTAMLAFNELNDLDTNKAEMMSELKNVASGQVTNAVRDTEIDGIKIKKDDFMGIIEGKIKVSQSNRKNVTIETLKKMITEDSEIVTILLGEDGDEAEAAEIAAEIENLFEEVEVEIHDGQQPVYPYILSVE